MAACARSAATTNAGRWRNASGRTCRRTDLCRAPKQSPSIQKSRASSAGYGKNAAKRGKVWLGGGGRRPAHVVAWWLQMGAWPRPQCLHKCDRPGCVRFSHLFEGTVRANVDDMIAKGRDRFTGGAKLTAEQVAEIRREGQPWVRSGRRIPRRGTALLVRRLAKRYGVHAITVQKILSNARWTKKRRKA